MVATIYSAWGLKDTPVIPLLILDMAGAFDYVSHPRLIHTLRSKGIPEKLVKYIQSFLRDRSTIIKTPEMDSRPTQTQTGIPQGSPFSPILYILFNSGLSEIIKNHDCHPIIFPDDTNFIAICKRVEENCEPLESYGQEASHCGPNRADRNSEQQRHN